MTDFMEEFRGHNDLSVPQIHQRYQQIKIATDAAGKLTDDQLRELCALARILRKRSSAPTAKTKVRPRLVALMPNLVNK